MIRQMKRQGKGAETLEKRTFFLQIQWISRRLCGSVVLEKKRQDGGALWRNRDVSEQMRSQEIC